MGAALDEWSVRWDTTRSDTGREMLLLGLTVAEGIRQQGVSLPFMKKYKV